MSVVVLITGATGAIGQALAQHYAVPGATLILQGRQGVVLAGLAETCRARGAHVHTHVLDIEDTDALMQWVRETDKRFPLDLLIVNAGVNTHVGPQGEAEDWDAVQTLINVNIKAAMATVQAALPGMRARGCGQIALVSSLAAYYGLPLTPAYSASKAALKAYGEGLRGWLAPEGVGVTVVMPGYVDSAMCRAMPGPKPFLWSPARAARVIARGLAANRPRISFPFPLNFGCWGLSVLRPSVSQWILRRLGYGGGRDDA